jgi:DNA-binding transcriptional LysR family regulator
MGKRLTDELGRQALMEVIALRIENFLCFKAIKHYMNFTEAAESLYMSQSALSKQIRNMEDVLGVTLFERGHSIIRLTPAGEQVAIHIEAILNEYEHMCLSAKHYQNIENKLRIATLFEMAQYGITDMIVTFEKKESDFHIESRECEHNNMLDLLETNQTDIVIGYQEFWPKLFAYTSVPLRKDRLVLIVNQHHPLAKYDTIELAAAKDERFCFPQEDSSLFKFFKDSCIAAGFVPRLTQSDVRLSTIRYYIRDGMRVTLQPYIRAMNSFIGSEFRIIELHDAPILTLSIIADDAKLSRTGKEFFKIRIVS